MHPDLLRPSAHLPGRREAAPAFAPAGTPPRHRASPRQRLRPALLCPATIILTLATALILLGIALAITPPPAAVADDPRARPTAPHAAAPAPAPWRGWKIADGNHVSPPERETGRLTA